MANDTEKTVITNVQQLVDYYHGLNCNDDLYVGIEWERSGVYNDTLAPVSYSGDRSYLSILKKLFSEVGWKITKGYREKIEEMQRGETRITLEGDGRLELTGSPQKNLHDLAREFRIHLNEIKEMSDFFNISWLSLGLQPFHNIEEIELLDKEFYGILENFYKENLDSTRIVRKANGLHINFSFLDQKNAINKTKIAFKIMPIVGAMFATSPLRNNEFSGYLNYRRKLMKTYDPVRNGLPDIILDQDFSMKDFIEFYFGKKVLCIWKDDLILVPKNLTFHQWIKSGYEGIFPTIQDFDKHVKTIWSDIRLRPSYLEYRVPDSVPYRMIMSIPALMKGILFDSESWRAVDELTKGWNYRTILELDEKAWKEGLNAKIEGKTLLSYAKELVEIANTALHKFGRTHGLSFDEDETVYLNPLKEQIYIKEKGLAREILEGWESGWKNNPHRLLEWCQR